MSPDADELRKYAEARDEAAFGAFVRRNVDLVYASAFRQLYGDAQLAEDVTQKVFISAARKASRLAGHPVVAAWLHQTTRYAAIDALREQARRRAREDRVSRGADESVGPAGASEQAPDWATLSPLLDEVVGSLKEGDREAVILRFFKGKSFGEIGGELGLTENAARMRVDRAVEKLRTQLARRGVSSSALALAAVLGEKAVMAAPVSLAAASIAAAVSAPAAAGIAGAWGILHFMSAAKLTATVASVIAVASLATAVFEYQAATAANERWGEAQHAVATAKAEAARAAPRRSFGPGPAAATAPSGQGKPAAASHWAQFTSMLQNPIFAKQSALLAQMRLDSQYGPLFKSLGLAPDQIDQFKKLLIEKEMVGFDSMSAAHDQGIDPATDLRGFGQAVATAEKGVDSQIQELLGSDGFGQFQQFLNSVPARNTTNLLQQALSYTATPLTDAQVGQVTQVLTSVGTPPLPPGNPFAVLNGDLGVVKLSDQGMAQLQSILSDSQLDVLKAKIQQQNQLLLAREQMGH